MLKQNLGWLKKGLFAIGVVSVLAGTTVVYAASNNSHNNNNGYGYGNHDLTEQCKNGGWKNFTNPTFKNQGECVSYFVSNNPHK